MKGIKVEFEDKDINKMSNEMAKQLPRISKFMKKEGIKSIIRSFK